MKEPEGYQTAANGCDFHMSSSEQAFVLFYFFLHCLKILINLFFFEVGLNII